MAEDLSIKEAQLKVDEWIKTFRNATPTKGETRVLIPGDPEREAEVRNRKYGIKLVPAIVDDLKAIAAEQEMIFRD